MTSARANGERKKTPRMNIKGFLKDINASIKKSASTVASGRTSPAQRRRSRVER